MKETEFTAWAEDINLDFEEPIKNVAYYRCFGIGGFLKKAMKTHEILGFTVIVEEGENNIGFLMRER